MESLGSIIGQVVTERLKQIEKGRTPVYDAENNKIYQLTDAAAYLLTSSGTVLPLHDDDEEKFLPLGWNKEAFQALLTKPWKERFIVAIALIIAELESQEVKVND